MLLVGLATYYVCSNLLSKHWVFEFLQHIRILLSFALIVPTIVGIIYRQFWLFFGAVALATVFLSPIMQVDRISTKVQNGVERLTFVTFNLNARNSDHKTAQQFFMKNKFDLLVLQEFSKEWANQLKPLKERYNRQEIRHFPHQHGVAIFSDHKLRVESFIYDENLNFAITVASLTLQSTKVSLLITHLKNPENSNAHKKRKQQADLVNKVISETEGDFLVIGDLNATPWSSIYMRMFSNIKAKCFSNSSVGTWPSWFIPLRIPIDQIVFCGKWRFPQFELGPNLSSDHLPLIASVKR